MSPRTRSCSRRSNELCKNASTHIQKYQRNTPNMTSYVESSAQDAARVTTSKRQPMSSIKRKASSRNLSKKVIGVLQSEQHPPPQISAETITTNEVHQTSRVPELNHYNNQDRGENHEQENMEQEVGDSQQEQSTDKQDNLCFKGEGKFYLNFPLPSFSTATSNISLLCGNKDLINSNQNQLRGDFNRILRNLKDTMKAVKTVAGKTESCRKHRYSTDSDGYEQQQNEEEQISKRLCHGQSKANKDNNLFTGISSRVLELQDKIKKGQDQLNMLYDQYEQLEKIYHEAFGVIHCNNGIARDAAVIQFSHKSNTIESSAFNLWRLSDKLDKEAKQLADVFMNESFEREKREYIDSEEQCSVN